MFEGFHLSSETPADIFDFLSTRAASQTVSNIVLKSYKYKRQPAEA